MKEYHKIQTVFKRNPETKFKTLLMDNYSLPEFEYLQNAWWVFTEKVDGTNIRVMWNGTDITFGGKTDNAQIPASLVTILNNMFLLIGRKKLFEEKFKDAQVCLYGEGFGAKIQKGGSYIPDGQDFCLFDVQIGDWWLQRKDVEDIGQAFGLTIVPIIGEGSLHEMVTLTQHGFKSKWGDFIAEGIVARPETELKCRNGYRVITKIKHKDFAFQGSAVTTERGMI